MTDKAKAKVDCPMPLPSPALSKLDILVGTWNMQGFDNSGGKIEGQEKYEWMDGGFFLKQEVIQEYAGLTIKSIQIIGFFREWGEDVENKNCTSYFFDNMGNSWEYVWEINNNALTIWTGYIGSHAAYEGTFSNDKNTITGKWKWPGGGYDSILTRVIENK